MNHQPLRSCVIKTLPPSRATSFWSAVYVVWRVWTFDPNFVMNSVYYLKPPKYSVVSHAEMQRRFALITSRTVSVWHGETP